MKKLDVEVVPKEKIDLVVDSHFGKEFRKISRRRELCYPRHVYMYCLFVFTDLRLVDIAQASGVSDHSTVIFIVDTMRGRCRIDKEHKERIIQIESQIEMLSN